MNRHDRKRWRQSRDFADLGDLVVAWLNGEIQQTPGHLGPPDPETIPLIGALTLANRAGFVTDNSQRAESHEGRTWNTWVSGFASDATLGALLAAIAGTGLELGACRGRQHCDHRHFGAHRCPWREVTGNWAARCPHVTWEIWGAWYVIVQDPVPGRNGVLWPALEGFAEVTQ